MTGLPPPIVVVLLPAGVAVAINAAHPTIIAADRILCMIVGARVKLVMEDESSKVVIKV